MVDLPLISSDFINQKRYFLLFETKLYDSRNYMSYLFFDPVDIIEARSFKEVERVFREIEQSSKKFYLAGYFAYELGYYFEKGLFKDNDAYRFPLVKLAVFKKRFYFNHKTGENNIDIPGLMPKKAFREEFLVSGLKLNITPGSYRDKILKIKDWIRKGDTYQVNLTAKYNFNFSGSAFSFYNDLSGRQRVQYSAFCKFDKESFISLSPELLFEREGLKIRSQPMKGTIARGKDAKGDSENIKRLKTSLKNKAENLMIIDLVRNDLGRIAVTGSVKVIDPFKVRKYETLFQMTSEVKSLLRKGITYRDIFKNIFPGGSVTGAPKIRAMQIIKEIENEPRGIYCGAVGFISPDKKAVFNLPIRTLSILNDKGEMGVGGGIVCDSLSWDELRECKLKARFLTERFDGFKLIETLLWDREYKFLQEHLKRLKASAGYFSFRHEPERIQAKLKEIAKELIPGERYKIRLLLDKAGFLESESLNIGREEGKGRIFISGYKTNPKDIFLYHKTTNRAIYKSEYSRYSAQGYLDVIFLNHQGELTEGAISNLIIQKRNRRYTPPLSSGLLPGIYRNYLIKRRLVKERVIKRDDLRAAEKVFLCNSVHGLREVKIVDKAVK